MKQIISHIAVVLSQFLTLQVQDCQTMYPPSSNTGELDIEMHTFGLLNTTKVHPRAVVHTGKRKTNPMLVPYTPVLL